jgi:hypothetical protein
MKFVDEFRDGELGQAVAARSSASSSRGATTR